VGHKIRFQDRTARTTRIKFMTDGILLAEAQKDRLFRAYDTIIVDEAHERSLNIDFLLGMLARTLAARPELKVIITSATIDPEKFSRAFGDAPALEVSGRTYPVEVLYRPAENPEDEDAEDVTCVDQAISAIDLLKSGPGKRGDILVFMPTESDIRETVQRLDEKHYLNTIVLPLFGRMAAGDQQRVFALTSRDKIVVATNVAETSITIPRIKYVVDTGLARIANYNARSKTRSLPVIPISQASADQRKGRCGRVAAGICVRLYSEEHYLGRPLYTPPEIQRSNLAEVILRMLSLRLGKIQDFPFLDPPSPAAIKDGFAVLRELGAVDEHHRLTPIGKTMARLPLDPRISRMLLEARRENALGELTILAAALSIQDPRERPLEQEAQADRAHAVFRDQRSDFVSLLKIWHACWHSEAGDTTNGHVYRVPSADEGPSPGSGTPPIPKPVEGVSAPPGESIAARSASFPACGAPASPSGARVPVTNGSSGGNGRKQTRRSLTQVRKFCRDHFLSFRRMREWRDIFEELHTILDELGDFVENTSPAAYEAIHRSILSGYLSQAALRKEKNIYNAARNRQAMIFPGSGLFNRGGQWIVASELVQTSRLFARTAANIEPEWLEELGRHLCKYSWSEPHWEKKRGQVVAFERATLYGLTVVDRRKVDYGRINPAEAREIFIRSALVEGELAGDHGFLDHNGDLVSRIEELESRARRRDLLVDDEALFRFYDERIGPFCDSRSFAGFIREKGDDEFLKMTEKDLLKVEPDLSELEQFPDTFDIGGLQLPLSYRFQPGEESDGITVTVPVHALAALEPAPFEWLVPGMLAEKVLVLMKGLPKGIRKNFVPVNDAARRIWQSLTYGEGEFYSELGRKIFELTGIRVSSDQWNIDELPGHLRIRFEVMGPEGNILGAGRELNDLRPGTMTRHDDRLWQEARKKWERENLSYGDFSELPESIDIGADALGLSRRAWFGLVEDGESVSIRLFDDPQKAHKSTRVGLMRLYNQAFGPELRQFRKDWVFPEQSTAKVFFMGSRREASATLYDYILRDIFELHSPQPPDRSRFLNNVEKLGGRIGTLGGRIFTAVLEVVNERHETFSVIDRYRRMARGNGAVLERLSAIAGETVALVPPDFLKHGGERRLSLLTRYLKALRIRAERAYVSPEKDESKEQRIAPILARFREVESVMLSGPAERPDAFQEEVSRMVEEFKISLFAPEIKTLFPISAKRIEKKIQEWATWKAGQPPI